MLTELEGHQGCVNCLQWNENGRYFLTTLFLLTYKYVILTLLWYVLAFSILASASDDFRVILWDPFLQKIKTNIKTLHRGNIFTVKVCLLNSI